MKHAFIAIAIVASLWTASAAAQTPARFRCDLGPLPGARRACAAVNDLVAFETKPYGYYMIWVERADNALLQAEKERIAGAEEVRAMLPLLGARARYAHTVRLANAIPSYEAVTNDYLSRLLQEVEAVERWGIDASGARRRIEGVINRYRNSRRTS